MLWECGFALDLSECAATGARDGSDLRLAEIGPRGQRRRRRGLSRPAAAVAGVPARREREPTLDEIADAFRLTGYFLERELFAPARAQTAGGARGAARRDRATALTRRGGGSTGSRGSDFMVR